MKICILILACVLAFPAHSRADDHTQPVTGFQSTINRILRTIDAPDLIKKAAGIDLDSLSRYLNWEMINISLRADMLNTTEIRGHATAVQSRLYKHGITALRMDIDGEITVAQADEPVVLRDIYILSYPLRQKSYVVLASQKTYMKTDPERTRELLGQLRERMDDRGADIRKREIVGSETIDGLECKKAHIIMHLESGIQCDIFVWLAESLAGFPVKIENRFTTARGINGINRTVFSNIEQTDHDPAMFRIPDDYTKCSNFVELVTGGRFGSRLPKPGKGPLRRR